MSMYINMTNSFLFGGGIFEDHPRKGKIREMWPHLRKRGFRIFNISLSLFFCVVETRWELHISLFHLLDYRREWLEDIFELSSDSDAPIH